MWWECEDEITWWDGEEEDITPETVAVTSNGYLSFDVIFPLQPSH